MEMDKADNQILHIAVMWYGVDFLPKLRALPIGDLEKVLREAGEVKDHLGNVTFNPKFV